MQDVHFSSTFYCTAGANDNVVVQRFPSWSLAAGSLTLVRTQFLTKWPLGCLDDDDVMY